MVKCGGKCPYYSLDTRVEILFEGAKNGVNVASASM